MITRAKISAVRVNSFVVVEQYIVIFLVIRNSSNKHRIGGAALINFLVPDAVYSRAALIQVNKVTSYFQWSSRLYIYNTFKVWFSFHPYVNFNSSYPLFKQCAFAMFSLFITYVITISNVVNLFPDTLKLYKLYLKSIQTLLIIYVTYIKDFSVLCASNHAATI